MIRDFHHGEKYRTSSALKSKSVCLVINPRDILATLASTVRKIPNKIAATSSCAAVSNGLRIKSFADRLSAIAGELFSKIREKLLKIKSKLMMIAQRYAIVSRVI